MKRSFLSTIYQGLNGFSDRWKEEPVKIWLGKPGSGYGLSSSLSGVAFCIVSEHGLKDNVLRINRVDVAKGRLEIFLWMLENAPKTLREAVRLTINYEQGS